MESVKVSVVLPSGQNVTFRIEGNKITCAFIEPGILSTFEAQYVAKRTIDELAQKGVFKIV